MTDLERPATVRSLREIDLLTQAELTCGCCTGSRAYKSCKKCGVQPRLAPDAAPVHGRGTGLPGKASQGHRTVTGSCCRFPCTD